MLLIDLYFKSQIFVKLFDVYENIYIYIFTTTISFYRLMQLLEKSQIIQNAQCSTFKKCLYWLKNGECVKMLLIGILKIWIEMAMMWFLWAMLYYLQSNQKYI